MKPGRKRAPILTEKELIIMKMLWANGPMRVREMLPNYEEPRPHFNTVSTLIRILEEKGHVKHENVTGGHRYTAITPRDSIRDHLLAQFVNDFYASSYKNAVAEFVESEKLTVDDLKDIIHAIEEKK